MQKYKYWLTTSISRANCVMQLSVFKARRSSGKACVGYSRQTKKDQCLKEENANEKYKITKTVSELKFANSPKTNSFSGFSKRRLLSSLYSSSWSNRQSSIFFFFFMRLAPAREFIGQNRLADTDNREAQRGICVSPQIWHPNNEQQLVEPMNKHYSPPIISKQSAMFVTLK